MTVMLLFWVALIALAVSGGWAGWGAGWGGWAAWGPGPWLLLPLLLWAAVVALPMAWRRMGGPGRRRG